jgi:hypothetical protein
MPTQEIPPQDWGTFFNMFSRQHEGWRVTVEVLGGEVGAGLEAREMPLVGITADMKDRNRAIAIILCETDSEHLTHIVSDPKSVRLKETEEGAHEALAIESENGITTLVRFRSSMRTEMLDDVLPDRPPGKTGGL